MNDQTIKLANLADTDNKEEAEKTSPEVSDEQGFLGSDPDPEMATETNTLEVAQEMGLYPNADEEHPSPLGDDNSNG
jgi:hypothetical protein